MQRFLYMLGFMVIITLFAQCNKKRTAENCRETTNTDCICPAVVDPVCGCNNVTYGNACEAECQGITDYVPGKCK